MSPFQIALRAKIGAIFGAKEVILSCLPVLCAGGLAVGGVQLVLRARRVRRGRVVLGRHRAARRRRETLVRLLMLQEKLF